MSLTPAIPCAPAPRERELPHLFEVLDCGAPLRRLARHSLAGVDEVLFCRGEGAVREGGTLRLGIADRWMSSTHARLRREGGCFRIADCGSTNGTLLNGAALGDEELRAGDLLEMGRTHFLFRAAPMGPRVFAHPSLATHSPELAAALAPAPAIARSMLPVIVAGETGTGKEVLARALHELSGRRGPFVAVNCAAITPSLLESELFGHRKGAFTGALESRQGLVRAADRGTLFLDEIGDLPLPAQAALLRVLQEGEVLAVGSTESVRVDVRVLAATHADLEEAVAAQRFRADLYARLAGFTLRLPPLRRRREDLGLLIAAMLRKHGGERATLTAEAGRALIRYRWPLNIRELEQCIASALVLAGDSPIDLVHLSGRVLQVPPAGGIPGLRPRPLSASEVERRHRVATLLREHGGNVAAVARALGKARMQVHRWVKRYDLSLADYR